MLMGLRMEPDRLMETQQHMVKWLYQTTRLRQDETGTVQSMKFARIALLVRLIGSRQITTINPTRAHLKR